ncbi:hypothetical protein JTB14_021412 [Gonioctena quinquepunctata]|nr:hypothetical protein JTB14_021412 [Gonioctena quinquepunctata]
MLSNEMIRYIAEYEHNEWQDILNTKTETIMTYPEMSILEYYLEELNSKLKPKANIPAEIEKGKVYEDEYFSHLSNAETDDEANEHKSGKFLETENNLKEITLAPNKNETPLANEKAEVPPHLYQKIIQLDGPTDSDGLFSSSFDEENLADLSMKKKNVQNIRNI